MGGTKTSFHPLKVVDAPAMLRRLTLLRCRLYCARLAPSTDELEHNVEEAEKLVDLLVEELTQRPVAAPASEEFIRRRRLRIEK